MTRYSQSVQAEAVVAALLADSTLSFREQGAYLRKGICPGCGKRELFVKKEEPWVVKCSRESNCAYSAPVRELLPHVFEDVAKKYTPTEEEPNRTADAYLGLERGFDVSKLRGFYEQGSYQIPNSNEFCPTVRVSFGEKRDRYWERLIGKTKKDGQKAHFPYGTTYAGDVWAAPDLTLSKGDRVFIVEGIFHAWALMQYGHKAVAAFSCSNFPGNFIERHKDTGVRWVLALDADPAGDRYTKSHAAKLAKMGQKFEVCRPPKDGRDWDDCMRGGLLGKEWFMENCFFRGRLFMAENANEAAYHHYVKKRREKFLFEFQNSLHSANVAAGGIIKDLGEKKESEDGADKAELPDIEAKLRTEEGRRAFMANSGLMLVANVYPEFLYIERDEILDEQRYVFKIRYGNGSREDLIALEGTHITSPDAFHKALLNKGLGATFDGDARTLKQLRDQWLNDHMMVVSSIPYVGYDRDAKAYVFQEMAYHQGREIPLNDHGYFEVQKQGIKTSLKSVRVNTAGKFERGWVENYLKAFSWQGMAALAYWLGSLFVQQIRAEHKTFPFLEFTGDPGAGKSTVLEFLWKLLGRDDYEGFDVMKSTIAGRRRAFSQVSNMPIVIIESDRDSGMPGAHVKQFDFDECKPFYNGRGTGTLGVAKRGNDIEESRFQAALVISQNAQVDGSEALLQRIVHCHADKSHHGPGTREIARWFERQTSDTVGGFLAVALRNEAKILQAYREAFERTEHNMTKGDPGGRGVLKNERVVKNHAQVAACGYALGVIFPEVPTNIWQRLEEYLFDRALNRERCLSSDHPVVEQFWEAVEYINGQGDQRDVEPLNHSNKPEVELAINLNHFRERCVHFNQEQLDMKLLKKLLPGSKRYKLVRSNYPMQSRHTKGTTRCWVFMKANTSNNR